MDPNIIFFNFIFVYLEINIICMILAAIIFFMVSPDMANDREVFAFRCLTAVYIVMLAIDCFTQLTYRHIITVPPIPLALIYALYTAGFGAMAFYWFRFLEFRIDPDVKYSNTFWGVMSVPLIILVIFAFGSVPFGWIFTINEEGIFQRGPFFALQTVVSYMYFIVSAAHAMIEASKERSPIRKRRLLIVASYVIIPMVGAVLQLTFSTGLPIVAPSISICLVFMFINIQRGQAHHDALTGLENRRSLDIYLESRIDKASEDDPFYLYMIDADGFKKINDVYGHLEGDRALKLIAEALQCQRIRCNRFVARFGGDEFVVLIDAGSQNYFDPGSFTEEVNKELAILCKKNDIAFPISISSGFTKCSSSNDKPKELIQKADKALYSRKTHADLQSHK